MLIKVSRDGKEIGTYEIEEAIRLLMAGTLRATDHYWQEGMAHWGVLSELQAQESLRKKMEEDQKAQREKEYDKKLEEWAVGAAKKKQAEEERASYFECHCCRESFDRPRGLSDMIGGGIVAIILGAFLSAVSVATSPILLFVAVLVSLFGLCRVAAAFIRSPHCPLCESTNFSKPPKLNK